MKARGRRSSAFIVSRCLEPLMKHEARVFWYSFLNEYYCLLFFVIVCYLYCLLFLFRFVNETIAIECDKNGLDGMCHLGVTQLMYSLSIQFSVRYG